MIDCLKLIVSEKLVILSCGISTDVLLPVLEACADANFISSDSIKARKDEKH